MLREMHIKFSADESHEDLKTRLQKENNKRWLKSIRQNEEAASSSKRVIRRKRSVSLPSTDVEDDKIQEKSRSFDAMDPFGEISYYGTQQEGDHQIENDRPQVFVKDKKAGYDPEKIFSRTKNVFKSIMKRAGSACELCGIRSGATLENGGVAALELHYITPLSQGGEHEVKNAAALCEKCCKQVSIRKNPADIKKLKRKAREKIYSSIKVVRKAKLKS